MAANGMKDSLSERNSKKDLAEKIKGSRLKLVDVGGEGKAVEK